MVSGLRQSKHESDFMADRYLYRSTGGALHYAVVTEPEISFCVNSTCQVMSQPLEIHWKAVKRILRYLPGTLQHELNLV